MRSWSYTLDLGWGNKETNLSVIMGKKNLGLIKLKKKKEKNNIWIGFILFIMVIQEFYSFKLMLRFILYHRCCMERCWGQRRFIKE